MLVYMYEQISVVDALNFLRFLIAPISRTIENRKLYVCSLLSFETFENEKIFNILTIPFFLDRRKSKNHNKIMVFEIKEQLCNTIII